MPGCSVLLAAQLASKSVQARCPRPQGRDRGAGDGQPRWTAGSRVQQRHCKILTFSGPGRTAVAFNLGLSLGSRRCSCDCLSFSFF